MPGYDDLFDAPTTIVNPNHKTWLCEEEVNGTACNTHNDVNDLICMKCDYEVDGWTKVKAEDVHEIQIGELYSYNDGVAEWRYFKHLKRGPILEDAPGNNAPVPRGTIDG